MTFVVGFRLGLTMTHTRKYAHMSRISVHSLWTESLDMIKLVKNSMKSVNCNLSICSISLASHASMELGRNYAIEQLTRRKSHITILIIIVVIVTVVHKWASVGLVASHELTGSSLHWYVLTQNGPCLLYCNTKWPLCLPLWEKTHLWQRDNRWMLICDPKMPLDGCR